MLAVATSRPPIPGGSKVMTQTKTDAHILQVGGWALGYKTRPHKKICSFEKLLKLEAGSLRTILEEAKVQQGL
jgi:hypothetical protein